MHAPGPNFWKVPSGEPKLIFFGSAGRKSKTSRLNIILFRGDVSVFGVVINIARHSIGIKNTTHSLVLYYSWEFCLLANSFLIQTVESTAEISLMDQHEISEVGPKCFCMSKCWFHSGAL